MLLAELDDLMGEREQLLVYVLPVQPRSFVVLAIGIVVAMLSPAEFVAGKQHRNAKRQEQRRDKIALLTRTQNVYGFAIAGRTLDAAVPGSIVGFAVAILFAVFFVVPIVVTNQVIQREAVMGGQKIDARVRLAAARFIQVRAARQPRCKLRQALVRAAPIIPHAVAIATVPFRPQHRKIADLVDASAQSPRLGN